MGKKRERHCCTELQFAHSSVGRTIGKFFRRKKSPPPIRVNLGITELGFACLVPVMAHSNLHQERLAKKKKRHSSHTGTGTGKSG